MSSAIQLRDRIRNLLRRIRLPRYLISIRARNEEMEPGEIELIGLRELNEELGAPRLSRRWTNDEDSEYESARTHLTEGESDYSSRLVVYYSSVLRPFFCGRNETYRLSDFQHAPRIEDYLHCDATFLGKVNTIRKLIIDGSNEQLHRKRVLLNARFDQLVHFEARFINFEEYGFLASPNINRIFLDAVFFGKLESDERPTDQFGSYPESFALLPKGQIKAFAAFDYLDEDFFRHMLDEQILDQVETLDRVHLNVEVGPPQAHHIITFIAGRNQFSKLRKMNVHIGKSIVQFLAYLDGFRDELLRACCLFVQWKGTLKLFGIPINRYYEVEPTIEFIEQLFRLMKVYHLVELNPTFVYFAVSKKTQSLVKRFSSMVRPDYLHLMKRFYSTVEVLQCLDIKDRPIFESFKNVWGASMRFSQGIFSTEKRKKEFYRKFLSQFQNCNSRIYALVVTGKAVSVGNLFLDRLPDNFPNLNSLKIETKAEIEFGFIFQLTNLSSLNLMLKQTITETTFCDLILGLSRLMYLRVLSRREGLSDDQYSLRLFKQKVDTLLREQERDYLVFSYKLAAGENCVQRIVKPVEEARKSIEEAGKPTEEAGKSTDEARESIEEARKPTEEAGKSTDKARESIEEARKSIEESGKPTDEAGESIEKTAGATDEDGRLTGEAGKPDEDSESIDEEVKRIALELDL